MRKTLAIVAATALITPVMAAQDQAPDARIQLELAKRQAELAAQVRAIAQGGASWVDVQTRVTRGKPYSGEAVTEFVQVLGDGNRIVRKNSERLFRDSDGRTRREPLDNDSGRNSIVITDPVGGTSFILNPANRTAAKSPATFARAEAGAYTISRGAGPRGGGEQKVEVITIPDPTVRARVEATEVTGKGRGGATVAFAGAGGSIMVAGPGQMTKDDLGQQQIEGVTATGTRTTTVIPAGTIGNEQPITIVSEQWFSTDLDVLVLTRHSDPRAGETTYRLTNISRSEPDRSLFQVPSDYTIEERKPPVIRFQQKQ
jgi:hypothetical protein